MGHRYIHVQLTGIYMVATCMEEMLVMPIQIINMPLALEVNLLQFIPQTHLHTVGANRRLDRE